MAGKHGSRMKMDALKPDPAWRRKTHSKGPLSEKAVALGHENCGQLS